MEQYIREMERVFCDSIHSFWAFVSGIFTSVLGYFLPVRDIVHALIIFFILDVILGYWAAKKLRGERFSVKIIWQHTMPRMLISIVLILGAFLWDETFNQDVVSTYKIVGWFISGVLLFSIAQNGYHITKWSVFPQLEKLLSSKIKDKTGMDVEEAHGTEVKAEDGQPDN